MTLIMSSLVFEIDDIPLEGLEFSKVQPRSHFNLNQPDCALCDDVHVEGNLKKVQKDVYLSGRIVSALDLICSRCLGSIRFPLHCKVSARFTPRTESQKGKAEVELQASDIDAESYSGNSGNQVDLTQAVHDHIVLNLPTICLCDENCRGLCQRCGADLNLENCDCDKDLAVDPRLEVLMELKDKLK